MDASSVRSLTGRNSSSSKSAVRPSSSGSELTIEHNDAEDDQNPAESPLEEHEAEFEFEPEVPEIPNVPNMPEVPLVAEVPVMVEVPVVPVVDEAESDPETEAKSQRASSHFSNTIMDSVNLDDDVPIEPVVEQTGNVFPDETDQTVRDC